MLFYLVLLFFLLIPIVFGFGLAVYLRREYDNPPPQPDVNEASPATENILDILKESSVAQDILLSKNKVSEEESNQTITEENNLDESLQSGSGFILEKQTGEQLASVLGGFREFSPENPEENILTEPHEGTEEKPEEVVSKRIPPQKTVPKITKGTFENIPVYETVPEELLETHLCMDQELLFATANSERLEAYDSFTAVPGSLLNRFEVISPSGAAHLVQTQDTAIVRKK